MAVEEETKRSLYKALCNSWPNPAGSISHLPATSSTEAKLAMDSRTLACPPPSHRVGWISINSWRKLPYNSQSDGWQPIRRDPRQTVQTQASQIYCPRSSVSFARKSTTRRQARWIRTRYRVRNTIIIITIIVCSQGVIIRHHLQERQPKLLAFLSIIHQGRWQADHLHQSNSQLIQSNNTFLEVTW